MPSSTSNSDPDNKHPIYPVAAQQALESTADGALPDGVRQPIYGKTLLVLLLCMALALGLVRAFALANDASSESILGRVIQAQKALPQIVAESQDLVMVFGSSMVGAGFSPREFDQWLSDEGVNNIKSFNFGFGGLNPFFQDYLARRIRDVFVQHDRRLKLAVIEFNPFQTTITRHEGARALEDSFLTMLASNAELVDVLLDDPTRGVRLFNIKYLRDSISAEMATFYFGGAFREPRSRTSLERDQRRQDRLQELGPLLNEAFEKEYPDYDGSDWYYPWQGGGTIAAERAPDTLALFDEYYELIMDPARLDDDRLNRIHSADIIDMHFSEELVAAFIRIVQEFQAFSEHVEVVMLPRNTDWIKYSAEGRARLEETISRIEQATGVTIQDHQDLPVIQPSMFSDTTHLNRYQGAANYTRFLVGEVLNWMQGKW